MKLHCLRTCRSVSLGCVGLRATTPFNRPFLACRSSRIAAEIAQQVDHSKTVCPFEHAASSRVVRIVGPCREPFCYLGVPFSFVAAWVHPGGRILCFP